MEKIVWPGWQTVRLLGRGSFGAVYEIERRIGNDNDVEKAAVKEISIPQSQSDIEEMRLGGYDDKSVTAHFQGIKDRIEQEYIAMAKLKGAVNIVYCDDIRSVQHDDGFGWDVYIKMELLTPLLNALKPLDEAKALKIGTDVCRALVMCGRIGIVHRDIKPQNIFVARDGTCKLGDFGVARTIEGTGSASARTGTYDYMAPEVYNGRRYGAKADLYSLGMVLYWLLNDCVGPFLPRSDVPPTLEMKTQARDRRFRGEPLPPPAHGSKEFKRIVLKACAFDQEERYRSAEELLWELEKLSGAAPGAESFFETDSVFRREQANAQRRTGTPADRTVGAWGERRSEPAGGQNSYAPGGTVPPARNRTVSGRESFYCKKCGARLDPGTKYCVNCGAPQAGGGGRGGKVPALIGAIAALAVIAIAVAVILSGGKGPGSETSSALPDPTSAPTGGSAAHMHEWGGWIVETPAGCETSGVEVRTCILDPAHQERRAIDPLGHDWAEATTKTPRTCRRCGAQEGEPLPRTPGPEDMEGCDSRIVAPQAESWLADYETRYVKSKNARCIVLRYKPVKEYTLEGGYSGNFQCRVWDKEAVTVLARQGNYSFIRTGAGLVGWVMTEHLITGS
ncbi:MAG: protein kinase [Oscillospiraceae bacterium]|nr:protein kinase [Oscillospiraceae bacterium]